MKILLVTNEDPGNIVGGLGIFIRDFSYALKQKVEVKILLIHLNRLEDVDSENKPSELVDYYIKVDRSYSENRICTRDVLKAEESIEVLEKCFPIFDEFKPDVIHINDRQVWLPFRNLHNTVFSLHLSMPDMVSLRGLDGFWFNELKIEKDACAKANALIVYSHFMQNVVWNSLCDFSAPLILPLGFDSSKYHSDKNPDKIVISFFGRLVEGHKGFVEFVQAVDSINSDLLNRYDVEFNLYGKGEVPKWLPTDRFTNIGFLEGDKLVEAYAKTNIVVMPSKYEPFGLVGLEALASGCLLLATEGLGMDEYLQKDKNYISIKADQFDIKNKIEMVLNNPGKFLGCENIIINSVSSWTWDRCVQEHLKVYLQVLQGRSNNLKWANGKMAFNVEKNWQETGDLRKENLDVVYKYIKEKLSDSKILVLCASEKEIECYKNENRTIIKHSIYKKEGCDCFHPEYILAPPDCVDESVFVYGPEFCANFDLVMQELCRITSSMVYLGVSFGSLSVGQVIEFASADDLIKGFKSVPFFKLLDTQIFEFIDEYSNQNKQMCVISLRKRDLKEIQENQKNHESQEKELK